MKTILSFEASKAIKRSCVRIAKLCYSCDEYILIVKYYDNDTRVYHVTSLELAIEMFENTIHHALL